VLRVDPQSTVARFWLAVALLDSGDKSATAAQIERAIAEFDRSHGDPSLLRASLFLKGLLQ